MRPPLPACACAEAEEDVVLEAELPFWIEADDVSVAFGEQQLAVDVRGGALSLRRTYWRNGWGVEGAGAEMRCGRLVQGNWRARAAGRLRLPTSSPSSPAGLPPPLARLHSQCALPVRPFPPLCSEEEARRRDYAVIDAPQCLWSLEEDSDAAGERCKLLVITLARTEPTEEEVTWKKGEPAWGP